MRVAFINTGFPKDSLEQISWDYLDCNTEDLGKLEYTLILESRLADPDCSSLTSPILSSAAQSPQLVLSLQLDVA